MMPSLGVVTLFRQVGEVSVEGLKEGGEECKRRCKALRGRMREALLAAGLE